MTATDPIVLPLAAVSSRSEFASNRSESIWFASDPLSPADSLFTFICDVEGSIGLFEYPYADNSAMIATVELVIDHLDSLYDCG